MSFKTVATTAGVILIVALKHGTATADPGCPVAGPGDAKRLIQTDENTKNWMTEAEIAQFSVSIHQLGRFGGFMDITDHQQKAVATLHPVDVLDRQTPSHRKQVEKLLPELSAKNLFDTVTKVSSYRNRHYQTESGLAAAMWIHDQFATLSRGRADVTVQLFQHAFKQPSVIARIAGKNPEKSAEVVVIGGHEDSMTALLGLPSPNTDAPGADDNASGIATMLEVFRVLMESSFRPDRTIEFIAYAAEERGLLGSQDLVQSYVAANRAVVGVLTLDMTMYPGKNHEITLVSDYVNKPLTVFTKQLIDLYVRAPWRETVCGFACSDHAAWNEAGYPVVFPFESPIEDCNPNVNSANDTVRNLDVTFGLNFAKLATAFAVELSLD